MATDPPILQYGDPPSRWGVAYESADGILNMLVPQSRRWQFVLPMALVAASIGGFFALGMFDAMRIAWRAAVAGQWSADVIWDLLLGVGFGVLVLTGVIWQVWYGFGTATHIRLDKDHLTITRISGPRRWSTTWKRHEVTSVKAAPVPWNSSPRLSLGLHVHASGREIAEVMEGHDPDLARWIASTIDQAIRHDVQTPLASQRASSAL